MTVLWWNMNQISTDTSVVVVLLSTIKRGGGRFGGLLAKSLGFLFVPCDLHSSFFIAA